uniref:Ig-like domain-containing protein n=1 Tax=Neogobius melanostomus TaxID=47308 RepID=A0A8C6UX70_9GOBI
MTTLTLTALLLCSISTCCCVWGLESSTVEVQSGQSATLLCSNFTSGSTAISWYRAVRRATLSRISVIYSSFEPASYTDGLEDGRFNVTSNSSHIFLTISPVNSSDTGFYFCGYESSMGLILKDSTYLDVHEVDTEGIYRRLLVPVLAGSVVVLILLIIGLAVKNKALQKAQDQERPGQTESERSENPLLYASVHFKPKSGSAASQSETEMSTYAAVKRTGRAPDSE